MAPISNEDRFSKLQCGRCTKPLSARHTKAGHAGATYWVCGECDDELRARGGQDRKAVWDCPTAAVGGSGFKCWF